MSEMEKQPDEQFLTRLCDIPMISTAWSQACSLYTTTKERNAFFEKTLSVAEASIKKAADAARPVINKCQPQSRHY